MTNETTNKTTIVAEPGTPLLTITRTFDAPRELLFRCFTELDLLAKWLGPRDMEMADAAAENRHGGTWSFVHRDPDGNEYGFRGVFHGDPSVDGITRTFEFAGAPGAVSMESLRFEEVGGKTTVVINAVHLSVESRDGMIAGGMERGVSEGNERLDALLRQLQGESANTGARS